MSKDHNSHFLPHEISLEVVAPIEIFFDFFLLSHMSFDVVLVVKK